MNFESSSGSSLDRKEQRPEPIDGNAVQEQAPRKDDYEAKLVSIDSRITEELDGLNKAEATLGLPLSNTSVAIDSLRTQRAQLADRQQGLTGEILGPDDEDPRVLRRFEELPPDLAAVIKKVDTKLRRMVIPDEELLTMPYDQLHDFALLGAGPGKYADDELLEQLRFPKDQPQYERSLPPHEMKDITPKEPRGGVVGSPESQAIRNQLDGPDESTSSKGRVR